ncbi:hypothetical protein [Streptomyces mirabilis]|uniref:hypothetical protein n=1 Tax=Streptomyces mirabilis TaxID=68239 RepID=UPI002254D15C|nr:hypothetical protein [Streptomyces mirabilis]MCX4430164.1 hypothetical protein [Streptomyces mirabilis]
MNQVAPLGYHQYLVAIHTGPQATASMIAGPPEPWRHRGRAMVLNVADRLSFVTA